jgi:hypothetical protein
MAKIECSELHRTSGGRNGFWLQLQAAVQCSRQLIAELDGSRKADMAASGAIHALALLAKEAPKNGLPVSKNEVDYWEELFFKWFQSIKRNFAEPQYAEFRANAEADFALIREKAEAFPHVPWEQLRQRYERPIRFASRQSFEQAYEKAKERYPVGLGIALDEYLQACV